MAKFKISQIVYGGARKPERVKIIIQNSALRIRFNAAASFRDINILQYLPEVVKAKFRNTPNVYIKDRVAEEINKLHAMQDEPLAPTAVSARHPELWKWAHSVFTNWEAAIAYTAEKYPEAKINYNAIRDSYHLKRKAIIEEIIRLLKSGKLSETSTSEWALSNFSETHERACIYYRTWEDAFNTAQVELHKRQIAEFFPKPKITKNPGFLS